MKLLNSANYGVPQKRERVIFIGIKKKFKKSKITFPKETHSKEDWVTVKDAIDDLKDINENKDLQQIYTNHSGTFLNKIKNTPEGKSVNPKYTEVFIDVQETNLLIRLKKIHELFLFIMKKIVL